MAGKPSPRGGKRRYTLTLKLWFNGIDAIIAHSAEQAIELWNDMTGDSYIADGYGDVDDWSAEPMEKEITVFFPDEREIFSDDLPPGAKISNGLHDWPEATATVGKWIEFHGKPEWFSGHEW